MTSDNPAKTPPQDPSSPVSRPGLSKKLIFSLIPAIIILGGLEFVLRVGGFEYQPRERKLWRPVVSEFVGTMENYYQTVFHPPGYLWVRADNIAKTPSGDIQYRWPLAKPPGVKRIAFLGGSTSEDGLDRPYPIRCIQLLNAAAGRVAYESLNVACSSYSSHQSRIMLDRVVLPRNPDVVVLYHGWNDSIIQSDGYPDAHKDALLDENFTEGEPNLLDKPRAWKLSQLIGKVMDATGYNAHKPRVPLDHFEDNYTYIISRCAEAGIPVVVVVRPLAEGGVVGGYPEQIVNWYSQFYGDDHLDIYKGIYADYTAIQREMAESYDNVRMADAPAAMTAAEQQVKDVPGVKIFLDDACHNTGYGYQVLAEAVAMQVAPELKVALEATMSSADYYEALARDFMASLAPHEAVYAARRAIDLDASRADILAPLITAAESQFEFVKLFETYRWQGKPTMDWREQIAGLQRAQALQPSDMGVMVQIMRVCQYTQHPEALGDAISTYHPRSPQERLGWLQARANAYGQTGQIGKAREMASQMLLVDPSNAFARQLLQATSAP